MKKQADKLNQIDKHSIKNAYVRRTAAHRRKKNNVHGENSQGERSDLVLKINSAQF